MGLVNQDKFMCVLIFYTKKHLKNIENDLIYIYKRYCLFFFPFNFIELWMCHKMTSFSLESSKVDILEGSLATRNSQLTTSSCCVLSLRFCRLLHYLCFFNLLLLPLHAHSKSFTSPSLLASNSLIASSFPPWPNTFSSFLFPLLSFPHGRRCSQVQVFQGSCHFNPFSL